MDNVTLPVTGSGTPDVVQATDDIAGIQYPLVKLVDGTADSATVVAAGGGVEANALRVTLASDSTGVLSVDDDGGSLTVDGTVTVTQATGTNLHAVVDSGTISTITNVVHVDDNASTLSVDDGAGSLTVDNPQLSVVGSGTEATALRVTVATDSTGVISVDDNGGSLTVDNAQLSVVGSGTEAAALRVTIATDSTGVLSVDDNGGNLSIDDGGNSITVDNGGTFAVQATLAAGAASIGKAEDVASADADVGVPAMAVRKATPANTSGTDGDYEMIQMSAGRLWTSATVDTALPAGNNNIGDVDVVTVPAPLSTTGNGTAAAALRVSIASDTTGVLAVTDNAGSLTVDNPTISVVGSGTEATAQRVTLATDSTGVLTVKQGTAANLLATANIKGNAGATLDSTVGAGTAPTNALVTGLLYNAAAPAPTDGQAMAMQADQSGNTKVFDGVGIAALSAWSSATSLNATQAVYTNSGAESVLLHLVQSSGSFSAGAVTVEVSYDGTNFVTIPADAVLDPASTTLAQVGLPYTFVTSTNKPFLLNSKGWRALRIKLSTAITGTGTVTPNYILLPFAPADTVVALSPTAANFNATVSQGTGSNLHTVVDSGTVTTVSTVTAVTGITNVVHVDDNAGSLTVDAPVGTPLFARLSDGSAALGSGNGTAASALRVSVASDSTGTLAVTQATASSLKVEPAGNVAHDAVDSGNPTKVGGRASNALKSATMVSSADRIDFVGDLDGTQIVRPHCPIADIIHVATSVTGTVSTALTAFSAVASTRNMITSVLVHNSGATDSYVELQDGSGGTGFARIPAPSKGGGLVAFTVPIPQPTVNTALFFKANDSSTTVFVTVTGFQTKAG